MSILYMLITGGILLNVLGVLFVAPYLNIIAFLMIAISAFRLAPLSKAFRTTRNLSFIAIPFSVLSLMIYLTNTGAMQHTITCTAIGINVFFLIYISYYYTCGAINYAAKQNLSATTRTLMATWVLFGMLIFLYFMMCTANLIPTLIFAGKLIVLIASSYFTYANYNVGKSLFH